MSKAIPRQPESEMHDRPPLVGFRLSKLEIYNWGTFDQTVYTMRPKGQTALLVGENGSGKSTVVDALLTLSFAHRHETTTLPQALPRMNEMNERIFAVLTTEPSVPMGVPKSSTCEAGRGTIRSPGVLRKR